MAVVVAFVTLVAVALLGYVLGRTRVLRSEYEVVLSRLAFYVATPCLLFGTLSRAHPRQVFSPVLLSNIIGLIVAWLFVVAVCRVWRRGVGDTVLTVLASTYVNAANLGIPIAVFVLGNGALSAPILLFQLVVITPTAFLILDAVRRGRDPRRPLRTRVATAVSRPFRNPMTVAVLLGLVVALTGLRLPAVVTSPIALVGGAAIPLALIAYGLSLSARGVRTDVPTTREVVLAVIVKVALLPAIVYLAGRTLGLRHEQLLAATLLAALPTAQNVYVYAVQYATARGLARRAVLLSTLASIPAMAVISLLLSGAGAR